MTARTPGPVFFGRGNWRRASRAQAQSVSQGSGGFPEGPRRVFRRLGRGVRRRLFRRARAGFPKGPGGLPQDPGQGQAQAVSQRPGGLPEGPRRASRRLGRRASRRVRRRASRGAQGLPRPPGPPGPRPGRPAPRPSGAEARARGRVRGAGPGIRLWGPRLRVFAFRQQLPWRCGPLVRTITGSPRAPPSGRGHGSARSLATGDAPATGLLEP